MHNTSILFALVVVLSVAVMAQIPTENYQDSNVETQGFKRFFKRVGGAFKRAGKKVGSGFKRAGNGMKTGFVKFGNKVKKGATFAGKNIVKGAKFVGTNIVTGAKFVGNQIEQGIYKLMRYGNHCGKGYGTADKPIVDDVDRACYNHDRCYESTEFGNCACDMDAIVELNRAKGRVGLKGKLAAKAGLLWLKKHGCKCIDPMTCRVSVNKNLKPGAFCNYKCRN